MCKSAFYYQQIWTERILSDRSRATSHLLSAQEGSDEPASGITRTKCVSRPITRYRASHEPAPAQLSLFPPFSPIKLGASMRGNRPSQLKRLTDACTLPSLDASRPNKLVFLPCNTSHFLNVRRALLRVVRNLICSGDSQR